MNSLYIFSKSKSIKELLVPRPQVIKNLTQMSTCTPVENSIRQKLSTNLNTVHLDVLNESYMHNVPKGAETHFKVVVVTDKFNGLSLIKRHRLINELLKDELNSGVHALSILAKTPDQWSTSEQTVDPSPTCRGGFGK